MVLFDENVVACNLPIFRNQLTIYDLSWSTILIRWLCSLMMSNLSTRSFFRWGASPPEDARK